MNAIRRDKATFGRLWQERIPGATTVEGSIARPKAYSMTQSYVNVQINKTNCSIHAVAEL